MKRALTTFHYGTDEGGHGTLVQGDLYDDEDHLVKDHPDWFEDVTPTRDTSQPAAAPRKPRVRKTTAKHTATAEEDTNQ